MFNVSIVDIKTTEIILKDMASCVILPGQEGELSVMDFHQSMLACLKQGAINVDDRHSIKIKNGVARTEANELFVLAEKA